MRRFLALFVAFAVASIALASTRAHGRVIELHRNSGFDRDLAGVDYVAPAGGTVEWTDNDLTGDADSGALLLSGPAGLYQLRICTLPELLLKPIRQFYEFSVGAQGGAGSSVLHEGFFTWLGEPGDAACGGPMVGWLRRYAPIATATSVDASIPAFSWPGLSVILQVTKSDAGPLLIDDWSIHVDEDMIFRDDDQPATIFSL